MLPRRGCTLRDTLRTGSSCDYVGRFPSVGLRPPCTLKSAHINANDVPATVCGAYAYKKRKLAPLANIINRHSSLTALVRDVAVLILFTQFITACHHVHTFPGGDLMEGEKMSCHE